MANTRTLDRDLRRISDLYIGVALETMRAMCDQILRDAYLKDDGVLRINVDHRTKARRYEEMFRPEHSEGIRRTFLSVNSCIDVIEVNGYWLTHCQQHMSTGAKFDFMEMRSERPKRVHKVELKFTNDPKPSETGYHHTFLLLVPNGNADTDATTIVADASYAQYSFDRGIDTLQEYWNTKVEDKESCTWIPFGDLDRLPNRGAEEKIYMKATTRTTNKVIVEELESIGGIEALLNMNTEDFEKTRDKIVETLKVQLIELRDRLDSLCYSTTQTDLDAFVEECNSQAHEDCLASHRKSKVTADRAHKELQKRR